MRKRILLAVAVLCLGLVSLAAKNTSLDGGPPEPCPPGGVCNPIN